MPNTLTIRGAREHNLKDIDLTLPRDQLIVITGLSGSGKSSLAFDTLYAEGQRRYVESLSAYARQFLQLMPKPDVDSIEGLSPAISIEQKTTSKNPRSTVGTVTEIYDYLRLLFARVGVPHSPETGLPIEAQTVSQMVDRLLTWPQDTRLYILAPLVRGRKGEYRKEIVQMRKDGFQRIKVDGTLYDIEDALSLDKKKKHDIDVVVDRVILGESTPELQARLAEAFEVALKLTRGLACVEDMTSGERTLFSSQFSCPVSGFTVAEIEPRLFSFNTPHGACPTCGGLGARIVFDIEKIIPHPTLSLDEGAIAPWLGTFHAYYIQVLQGLATYYQFSLHTPFQDFPERIQNILLHGSGKEKVPVTVSDGSRSFRSDKPFEGVILFLTQRWKEQEKSGKAHKLEEISQYQSSHACADCSGHRLKPQALAVKVAGKHIGEITALSITQSLAWAQSLEAQLAPQQQAIATRILKEIEERLFFLSSVGLGYLTLARASGTLSGGESQRIRLASQIGSGLTGVLYILDEPSIGLHQRDNDRLLLTLKRLRDLGNTVIVVEHDEDAIRAADHVVDMGPGAGTHGGSVVAAGPPAKVIQHPQSLTGAYLTGKRSIPIPATRRSGDAEKALVITGATANNLQNVTASFPLGKLICVTGVSGGGKSSLVIETLYKGLAHILHKATEKSAPYTSITGTELIDKIIDIDQSPIGRTPRSNPATYTGMFTPIREWFAKLPEARARGYGAGRFSFNVKGGRCEACTGDGVVKIEMHFLPDVYVTCDVCQGRRYNRETLSVTFKDKSIADILDMTVEDALPFFEAIPGIRDKLETLNRVGLGYIQVGQRATTLSGGEAQRIKLAKELSRRQTGRTLYILDEPTTGLHFEDIRKLMEILHSLVDQGNTVLVIEHNLDVIKTADWIIDIGPEGGDAGGQIVGTGTPEDLIHIPQSYTGAYLRKYLSTTRDEDTYSSSSSIVPV